MMPQPAPVGFRWHLVRSRPLGGGVSDGLASGSRAGETATPDEPDAYYPRGSPWAWHAHRLDVADALPGDVLSVWAAWWLGEGPGVLVPLLGRELRKDGQVRGVVDEHGAGDGLRPDRSVLAVPSRGPLPAEGTHGGGLS